jgi:hypothetical protein
MFRKFIILVIHHKLFEKNLIYLSPGFHKTNENFFKLPLTPIPFTFPPSQEYWLYCGQMAKFDKWNREDPMLPAVRFTEIYLH